jgi:phosphoglycerate dehydrogenase-like enzyme
LSTFLSFPQFKETEIVIVCSGIQAKLLHEIWPYIPKVRWLHSFLTGVDLIAPFLQSLPPKFAVTNGRGAFSTSLAEYVLTMILFFNKQVPRLIANQGEKKWDKFIMNMMESKVIGFVGFGHIGQSTALLINNCNLGTKCIVLQRAKEGKKKELVGNRLRIDKFYGSEFKSDFFGACDFVVCSLPGTKETKNFMGATEFAAMKPTAFFINVGRGTVVDEDALVDAIQSKKIAGAALDVFQQEPLSKESSLWSTPNILISSHNADYTSDYHSLGWKIFVENFNCYRTGKPLLTLVDKSAGY